MSPNRKEVGRFRWPFFRYDVLLPEPIESDSLVWLYISLVLLKNTELRRNGERRLLFDDIVREAVDGIIMDKFSEVIDKTTLAKINGKIVNGFVYLDTRSNRSYLKDETLDFMDSNKFLFSDTVKTYRLFQDALTGEVVPFFDSYELEHIRDCLEKSLPTMQIRVKRHPRTEKIKNALIHYDRMKVSPNPEEVAAPDSQFIDLDEEVDFTPETEPVVSEPRKYDVASKSRFTVFFLDNPRSLFQLEVKVVLDDNKLEVESPFDRNLTNAWLNDILIQARKSGRCDDLNSFWSELENEHLLSEDTAAPQHYSGNVAEQLKYFGKVYQRLEDIDAKKHAIISTDAKKLLIAVDSFFESRSDSYHGKLGKFLECLITPLRDCHKRKHFKESVYIAQLEQVAVKKNVDLSRLIGNNAIFKEWQRNGSGFKAQVANIVLSNSFLRRKGTPREFVNEIFDLYDARNRGEHYRMNHIPVYHEHDIEKLFRVVNVLIDLY